MNASDVRQPTVFISYAHDNEDLRAKVLALADRLNTEGIDCWCDRYIEGSSPELGWSHWMDEKVRTSDYVFVVASKKYLDRYEGRESAGKGLGGKFESILVVDGIYQNDSKNTKFIPVVFDVADKALIINPLRQATYYNVADETSYEFLYRRITNQIKIQKPKVGSITIFHEDGNAVGNQIPGDLADEKDILCSEFPEIPQFTNAMKPGLKIVQAFFKLGVVARFQIAKQLNLLEESESYDSPDPIGLSTKILIRAQERNLMKSLWDLLFDTKIDPNPFN